MPGRPDPRYRLLDMERSYMSDTRYEIAIRELLSHAGAFNPSMVLEEIFDAIEDDDYRIVHKSQVRSRDELLRHFKLNGTEDA